MARWTSGIVLAAAVVLLLWKAPFWLCSLVVLALAVLAMLEFTAMFLKDASVPEKITGVFSVLILAAPFLYLPRFGSIPLKLVEKIAHGGVRGGSHLTGIDGFTGLHFMMFPAAAFAVIALPAVFYFVSKLDLQRSAPRYLALVGGSFYIALPFGCLNLLLANRPLLLGTLAVTYLADTGAYLAGRFFGGPKMAPRLSPGKTWSGFCGGLLGGAAASCAGLYWTGGALPAEAFALAAFAGALLALFGVLGDLTESFLKRGAGVKDSGTLIPGHGGVLDRLDSLMFTAPVVAVGGFFAAGASHWLFWRE